MSRRRPAPVFPPYPERARNMPALIIRVWARIYYPKFPLRSIQHPLVQHLRRDQRDVHSVSHLLKSQFSVPETCHSERERSLALFHFSCYTGYAKRSNSHTYMEIVHARRSTDLTLDVAENARAFDGAGTGFTARSLGTHYLPRP